MEIIVQKFGGTSLSDNKTRELVTNKIIDKYNKKMGVVVVVSAMGRLGNPYATDTLLSLIDKGYSDLRDIDLLMSCGEMISSVILANLLNKKGFKTCVLTGYQAGIETDDTFGNAKILSVNTDKINDALNQNKIVIVTGFQGGTSNGELTTLGRGGSDTSAVVLAESLNCKSVEIYTDVDGIMTADPRIVPDAKVIDSICYNELYQLAEDGAKVIHPRAVEIAERSNIEVIIKNTMTNCEGTVVGGIRFNDFRYNNDYMNKYQVINAITYKNNRTQITINGIYKQNEIDNLMTNITQSDISIDLINFFTDKKVFTIDSENTVLIKDILEKGNYNYNIIERCCKLSLIGHKMHGIPGVMAKIVNTLNKANIEILQSADSHTTIWCLVRHEDSSKALQVLHKEFGLGEK